MKKYFLVGTGVILILPLLLVVEYVYNSLYAISLRHTLSDMRHPNSSMLIKKDWSVANCGPASNQCCYAYVEFRSTSESRAQIEEWYSGVVGQPSLLKNEGFELFFMRDAWEIQQTHAFFDREYDDIFAKAGADTSVYGVGYVESGRPAGFDFRCH
jgi:hypothetical protein